MKWVKKGFICSKDTFNISWYKKNTMTPLPYLYNDNILRIYLTMCDADNIGRVGYIDLDIDNPSNILKISENPVLDIGIPGSFDEHGVLPTSLLKEDGKLYLYYSAYQRQVSVPYIILSGLAVSDDNGDTFKRISDAPVLDRKNGELFQRSAIEVMKKDGKYKMWYTSNIGWINNGKHIAPEYDLKYLQSDKKDLWLGEPKLSLALKGDEYGLTMPQVFFEDGIYKMYYSVRSISKGYRLGYAESKDGIIFERMDEKMEIDVSKDGFDSEMLCFGKIFKHNNNTYLFYCGNNYGQGGLGFAELEG
ncbi:MAG: hypothetical protein BWY78_00749 [Alphaproteobacteria bacterium ADurb.Bin438]|nr:MAG: hypothetical protein BWY78_00749 [Alphaproteobacteria bacterium ADurb.Bin438]